MTKFPLNRYAWPCLLAAASIVGCDSDSLTVPDTATLQIVTATSGSEIDPDGYSVQIDGGAPQTVAASSSTQVTDIEPGEHTVQLGGMAANCVLEGENPRPITVQQGETATVTFTVTCGPSSGGLQVTASTTGSSPDADGYVLTVDGSERGTLPANGTLTVSGLAAGAHAVGLGGIAANCQVQGDNPQSATVTPGQPGAASFAVVCTAPPTSSGTLRITTVTTGGGTDPDGYSIAVDGGAAQPIAVNGNVSLANVAAGSHSVGLSGLAANCALQGANPRSATVGAGATAQLRFEITCTGGGGGGGGGGSNGSIQVAVTTTGAPADPDGYTLALDGGAPVVVAIAASHGFDPVAPGEHRVELGGMAANCAVADANPRPVSVTAGQAASIAFAVTCGSSALRWSEMASGTQTDLRDVWGSSATDVMAVGGSTILHYDGSAWSTQTTITDASLASVWGASATSFVAVGQAPAGKAAAYRYDGTGWTPMPAPNPEPDDPEVNSQLRAVWGASDQDLFAVGHYSANSTEFDLRGLVARYDGSAWTVMQLPDRAGGTLADVYGTSSTNVIAVGTGDEPMDDIPAYGLVYRFDGTSWTRQHIQREDLDASLSLGAVWASSPTDVFVVGFEEGPVAGSGAVVYHSDGSGFVKMEIPPTQLLTGLWGTSATDVYAVGDGVLHYDGQSWTRLDDHGGLADLWGSSSSDLFVVGNGGRILHGAP